MVEVIDGRPVQTTEVRRTKRGTPQGGVTTPLLANCYFGASSWPATTMVIGTNSTHTDDADGETDGAPRAGGEHDQDPDRPSARGAVRLPRLHGGSFHGKDGRPCIGTRPSKKSVKNLLSVSTGGLRVSGIRMNLPARRLASAA